MMKSWITLILILIASLPNLPSIKEGLKFLFPLLSISFRNSRQPFLPLLILLKTIASWLVMVVMLFTQQILKLSKILTNRTLLIIKVITICILMASLMLLVRLLLTLLYNRVKSLMNVRLSTSCLISFSLMSQVNISLLLIEDTNLTTCFFIVSLNILVMFSV